MQTEKEEIELDVETAAVFENSSDAAENGDDRAEENDGNHQHNDDEEAQGETVVLNPPKSQGEHCRDSLLRVLDHKVFQYIGLLVLFCIIADGALFFFFLMGWQTLCRPRTDCEPRNWIYNFSVQVLNVLFTYMCVVSMPWRSAQFLHASGLSCPQRSNKIGHDLYGLETKEIWYFIPLRRRLGIDVCLLLNCLTQFTNQATRIIWHDYESQDTHPGNIWTNVFFAASFAFGATAAAWMTVEEHFLRRDDPDKFPPSMFELAKEYWQRYTSCWRGTKEEGEEDEEEHHHVELAEPVDSVCNEHHEHVLPLERASLRMWAL